MSVTCLKCGSDQITSKTVPADGTHPARTMVVCLRCGNEWDPKDYDRLLREANQKEQERKAAAWKAAFYAAVEAHDTAKATALMNESAELRGRFTDPQAAYDYLKKKDRTANYVVIGIFVVFVLIVLYLVL